jgi:hypothetical protein
LHVFRVCDFFSTGQSLFSYATALREAGAAEIRAVVLQRMVRNDYYAVLAWLRRTHDVTWRPERAWPTVPA